MIFASLCKQFQINFMSVNGNLKNCSLEFAVLNSEKALQSSNTLLSLTTVQLTGFVLLNFECEVT